MRGLMYDFKDEGCRAKVALVANRWNIDPVLAAAIVMQESAGNPDAFRPEYNWKWFWDVRNNKPFRQLLPSEIGAFHAPEDFHSLAGTADSEWHLQRSSMGLTQVMGSVARELGCKELYLSVLFDPFTNLQYGCKKLAQLANQYGPGGISAYNAGSPHPGSDYEKSVLRWMDKLRPLFV